MRLLFLAAALLAFCAHAERATERYAPAQIFVARDLLERARAAAALDEYAAVRTFAQQAQVDARIAWGMTDTPALRAEAEAILAEARALAATSRAPAPASYPPPSVQARASRP
jgi:hypothetical protein